MVLLKLNQIKLTKHPAKGQPVKADHIAGEGEKEGGRREGGWV